MKTFDLRLEFKQRGSLLDAQFILEGIHKVGYWNYDSKAKLFYKDLPEYSIEDNSLLVAFKIEGKTGAKGNLKIIIGGNSVGELACTVPEGANTCLTEKEIDLNEAV